jgi:hypothetical protein
MSEARFDQRIREHYETQKLSAEALDRLKRSIADEAGRPESRRWKRGWRIAFAAAMLIAIPGSLLVVEQTFSPLTRAAAKEAAREHNLRLHVEIVTADYAELRARMSNVGFSPVEPDSLKGSGMRLLGARYGSLRGQPAIQLKLADARGEICTLTEVRPAGVLTVVLIRRRHHVDGLVVDLWREKGLVMVLTRPLG